MNDQALKKYNWKPAEDAILANVVLEHIAGNLKMMDAYKLASGLIDGRTQDACDFRWNNALKKRLKPEIEKAKVAKALVRLNRAAEVPDAVHMKPVDVDRLQHEYDYDQEEDETGFPTPAAKEAAPYEMEAAPYEIPSRTPVITAEPEDEPVPPSKARQLYEDMLNAIDAVLDHGLSGQATILALEATVQQVKSENEMLWERVRELEAKEAQFNIISQAIAQIQHANSIKEE